MKRPRIVTPGQPQVPLLTLTVSQNGIPVSINIDIPTAVQAYFVIGKWLSDNLCPSIEAAPDLDIPAEWQKGN